MNDNEEVTKRGRLGLLWEIRCSFISPAEAQHTKTDMLSFFITT